jgi:hypothetical protein
MYTHGLFAHILVVMLVDTILYTHRGTIIKRRYFIIIFRPFDYALCTLFNVNHLNGPEDINVYCDRWFIMLLCAATSSNVRLQKIASVFRFCSLLDSISKNFLLNIFTAVILRCDLKYCLRTALHLIWHYRLCFETGGRTNKKKKW